MKNVQSCKHDVHKIACVATVFDSYSARNCNHILNLWILYDILNAAVKTEIFELSNLWIMSYKLKSGEEGEAGSYSEALSGT